MGTTGQTDGGMVTLTEHFNGKTSRVGAVKITRLASSEVNFPTGNVPLRSRDQMR